MQGACPDLWDDLSVAIASTARSVATRAYRPARSARPVDGGYVRCPPRWPPRRARPNTPDPVYVLVISVLGALRAALLSRTDLAVENLALRHQLAILIHATPRPRLREMDRAV